MYFRSEFSTPVLYKTKEISDNDWSWLGRVNRTDTNLQPSNSNVTTLGQKEGTSLVVCLFAALVWKMISVCCFVLFQRILRLEKKMVGYGMQKKLTQPLIIAFAQSIFLAGRRHLKIIYLLKCQKWLIQKCLKRGSPEIAGTCTRVFKSFPIVAESEHELSGIIF